jgi:modification methylase
METNDYKERTYLSAIEAAKYLDIPVNALHDLANSKKIDVQLATSGQMRFSITSLKNYEQETGIRKRRDTLHQSRSTVLEFNGFRQHVITGSSTQMTDVSDESVHLIVTSPPYFNAKMYSRDVLENNLGDVHDVKEWFERIGEVWQECFRVLQSGRKIFINIMNLPIRLDGGSYRTLNLVGQTIDLCEKIGFIFKRDIIWQKTNGVRAHFGTYPYPGGILINNMHEFILEFDKPNKKTSVSKYAHLSDEQKEASKLDKDFWLSLKNSDVWMMKPEASGENRTHVAPFPYELPYRIIKAFSYVSETVLDPFLGSGTTCRAALDLQRNSVGYELNPEIADDTVKYLQSASIRLI